MQTCTLAHDISDQYAGKAQVSNDCHQLKMADKESEYEDDPGYYHDEYLQRKVNAAIYPWDRAKVSALDEYYGSLQTRENCFTRLASMDKELAAV